MDKNQINDLFGKFNNLKILVLGDVMVDSYMWGDVNRISPEAPVPIVSANKSENRLGGAANVALNIKALGATPLLCSVIGKGEAGVTFIELMSKDNIPNQGIVIDKKRLTTKKTRVIANHQQLIRIDEENTKYIEEETAALLKEKIQTAVEKDKANGIIIQDYNKGVITRNIIDFTTELANKYNIPVLVDPKKNNFNYFKDVTLFKPNLREFKEGTNTEIDVDSLNELQKNIRSFLEEKNIEIMLLTLSEKGIMICSKNTCHHIPTQIRDVADVSGAGDTVISTASVCLASGCNLYDIAFISNLAGGQVCEKVGVVPVDKNKLMNKLNIILSKATS